MQDSAHHGRAQDRAARGTTRPMISEAIARKAEKAVPRKLDLFEEFLGTGVVEIDKGTHDMAVAIYVSMPLKRLSESFLRAVPKHIKTSDGPRTVLVPTKIVTLGTLSVH